LGTGASLPFAHSSYLPQQTEHNKYSGKKQMVSPAALLETGVSSLPLPNKK